MIVDKAADACRSRPHHVAEHEHVDRAQLAERDARAHADHLLHDALDSACRASASNVRPLTLMGPISGKLIVPSRLTGRKYFVVLAAEQLDVDGVAGADARSRRAPECRCPVRTDALERSNRS